MPGCLLRDGGALRQAQRANDRTYPEVTASQLGRLCCLSVEVFGRWGDDPVWLVPALAAERARELPRRIRRGSELALMRRWWGLLGIAVQKAVARCVIDDVGVDLPVEALEAPPGSQTCPCSKRVPRAVAVRAHNKHLSAIARSGIVSCLHAFHLELMATVTV